jgi:hypothetical protein
VVKLLRYSVVVPNVIVRSFLMVDHVSVPKNVSGLWIRVSVVWDVMAVLMRDAQLTTNGTIPMEGCMRFCGKGAVSLRSEADLHSWSLGSVLWMWGRGVVSWSLRGGNVFGFLVCQVQVKR